MTLCVAFIREIGQTEELVFATDSTLTGGEKWNNGIKLFELPRSDCLLCFAGHTEKAYPLVLNLIPSIKLNKRLRSLHTDIEEVMDYLCTLFTSLVNEIQIEIEGASVDESRAGAQFLFGGWSWLENRFRIWQLSYSSAANGFVPKEIVEGKDNTGILIFMGDEDVEVIANERFQEEYVDPFLDENYDRNARLRLNLEPLRILIDIIRQPDVRHVDGAIQLAKIYKSGSAEFFGVLWPSVEGTLHYQGREITSYDRPDVRYFDPDTLEIVEEPLPDFITDWTVFENRADIEFIRECYEDDKLSRRLNGRDRARLRAIIREVAYTTFIDLLRTDREAA